MKYYILLILAFPLYVYGQDIVIKDVNVLDVENKRILQGMSVLISEGKIKDIKKSKQLKISARDTIIDGMSKYLMPGLIDSHIHFFQSGGLYARPDAVDFRKITSYADEVQFTKSSVTDFLRRYLRLGITTVVDVGGPFWNFTVRDSIGRGMVAPNILVTGPLFSTYEVPELDLGDPPIIKVSTREDVASLFNKMLTYRPDLIKFWYIATKDLPAERNYQLVEYLGELCRSNQLKLAVHATQLTTARLAVKAGANILVHSIDDELIPTTFIAELKKKNVTYVPTLTVNEGYVNTFTGILNHTDQDLKWANSTAYNSLMDLEKIDTVAWPQFLKKIYRNREAASRYEPSDTIMIENLQKLYKAGVNIAVGTDAGNIGTMHASSYLHELLAMKKSGLTNWDLLECGTINSARGFGIADRLGSIEIGKQADLILLEKNPLDDIRNLGTMALLVKSGELLVPDSILIESAEQLVQRQVNAYNARNLNAFFDTYAQDVEIYDVEDKLIMKGHDEMRAGYAEMFNTIPNLYCEIENRIVINNKVIDKEKVRYHDKWHQAVAIYEVMDGKIKKVKFIE